VTRLLLIALGGGIGSALRFLVSERITPGLWSAKPGATPPFPLATLAVNATGCFAAGLFAAWYITSAAREDLRLFLVVGLLGGYTTFSAFGKETVLLAQAGQWGHAALNVALSNALCLAGVWLGLRAGAILTPAHAP
jgi:CrcB protein